LTQWTSPANGWRCVLVWQEPTNRMVERSAPGGEGPMLNPLSADAVRHYLERFDAAFANGARLPRAMYHDSYEYHGNNWAPELFDAFEAAHGYRLQDHLPSFFGDAGDEVQARLKHDYRETVSTMMLENFLIPWQRWAAGHGCLTRNQAHGSPGNLLDFYAAADIPETEMFRRDRDPLMAKFAASAAHVTGKRLVACETGTWLREHFTVTLADLKDLIDEQFASGVNHLFYHGTCYSPADATWPGWVFYASTQMNPRNAIWHDASVLNAYIARCQGVLQAGDPDGEVLVYWPIHDLWQRADGLAEELSVHHTTWLTEMPLGATARHLWNRGYAFDYASDRMICRARVVEGKVRVDEGETYDCVLVPPCTLLPEATMAALSALANAGATVLFQEAMPSDVPGLADLEERRALLAKTRGEWTFETCGGVRTAETGHGTVSVGEDLEALLARAEVRREALVDRGDLLYTRRRHADGRYYFIAHRAGEALPSGTGWAVDDWVPLTVGEAASVEAMDPMTGEVGTLPIMHDAREPRVTRVYLQLRAGQSILLRTCNVPDVTAVPYPRYQPTGKSVAVAGPWHLSFISGGPNLPQPATMDELASWTELGADATAFAGTVVYRASFDAPGSCEDGLLLDLGTVAVSARVRVNGEDVARCIAPPFVVRVPGTALQPADNALEVEVTSLSANRIRDLDRQGVQWRCFRDINFVNIDYKPFDALDWPVRRCGLLGPVHVQGLEVLP